MHKYIFKRLLWVIPVLFGVSLIVFAIMHFSPGDPATVILGESAKPEAIAQLREQMGLNQPFIVQYFRYIGNAVFKLDLGRSFINNRPVIGEILIRLPNTIKLAGLSITLAAIVGIPLGVIASRKPYSALDNTTMFVSLLGVSMPTFWQGLLLILVFSLQLRMFPSTGFETWQQMVLPVITLASSSIGSIARITRSSMLDVMGQDFIRTAKAKGISEFRVVYVHILRNALLPVVTVIGLQFGSLLGGAVLTESIFSINGLGTLMVNAIRQRDLVVVQGGVLFIAFIFTLVNLCVDVLYAYIDPRIRSQYK
ncbi:ABC transporter permease [Erysipelothrix sp. HDW6C]|uniref:ABC transporter permease n=1 Tax=Erysipelothrix sp. HDW6C TaxID=2714930 RepID=UPI00140E6B3F|nr:ABC transporter permease [Erysipelothrix sp. HDW6C]QIK69835.1 ABC transporter permease [Erysipelothrix sp. HDW6C]